MEKWKNLHLSTFPQPVFSVLKVLYQRAPDPIYRKKLALSKFSCRRRKEVRIIKERSGSNPIRDKFLDKLSSFEKKSPEDAKTLSGELLLWGASINGGENLTLWNCIEDQINSRVDLRNGIGTNTTPEMFIDELFELNQTGQITSDIVMWRLQNG